ncbi:MAG: hypothetical protein JWM41_3010 [Gemmatimonadetes bacterium]|nr:hypothetical protein [Gemmatimonadota bacterium]
MRDRKLARLAAWVLCILVLAGTLEAQTVRGRVLSRSGASVDGAVLLLIDSAGGVAARALSTGTGAYALRASAPGRFRVRALRIGFRPVDSDRFTLSGDTTIVLRMTDDSRPLPAVTTVERGQCHVRPDSLLVVGVLWDDAKTALYAAAITRDDRGYLFDIVDHTRRYDFASHDLLDIAFSENSVRDTRSWASVPPERLRRDGYVLEARDSTTFVAPDIEVLLSSYFADTHCLRVHDKPGHPSMVGIDFTPAQHFGHVEVRGTFWLDRATQELSSLDFSYVDFGLSATDDTLAGGHVELARLSTGARVMTNWSIRMPIGHAVTERHVSSPHRTMRRAGGGSTALSVLDRQEWTVDEIRVTGGTLRNVRRDTVVVWSRQTGAVDVHVSARGDSGVSGAIVSLVGSPGVQRSNATGGVAFERLVPGEYLLDVGTDELDALGWPRNRVHVEIDTVARAIARVTIESSIDAARSTCGVDARSLPDDAGVIVGAVTRREHPVEGKLITASWTVGSGGPGGSTTKTAKTLAGDGGFLLCGVPRERAVSIHVAGDSTVTMAQLGRGQVVRVLPVALP